MHTRTLFEILSEDRCIIVASDVETSRIWTWNGSLTFQTCELGCTGRWWEVEANVTMTTPESFQEAREIALRLREGSYE